jgi:putative ABC transport system substrate-binding protein
MVNPDYVLTSRVVGFAQEAAAEKQMCLHIVNARDQHELDAAFLSIALLPADAAFVGSDPFFYNQRQQIAALALRHRVPASFELREFAAAGGLVSFGSPLDSLYRQAAGYVARILAGAKPADLPVQDPTKFELVINVATAKALGLTVPPLLLARADEIIE